MHLSSPVTATTYSPVLVEVSLITASSLVSDLADAEDAPASRPSAGASPSGAMSSFRRFSGGSDSFSGVNEGIEVSGPASD
jgi:hypothetical protein